MTLTGASEIQNDRKGTRVSHVCVSVCVEVSGRWEDRKGPRELGRKGGWSTPWRRKVRGGYLRAGRDKQVLAEGLTKTTERERDPKSLSILSVCLLSAL